MDAKSKGIRGIECKPVELQDETFYVNELTMLQFDELASLFEETEIKELSEVLEYIYDANKLANMLVNKKLHKKFIKVIVSDFDEFDNTPDDIDWQYITLRQVVRLVKVFLGLNKSLRKDVRSWLKDLGTQVTTILPRLMGLSGVENSTNLEESKKNTEESKQQDNPSEKSEKT